MDVTPLVPAGRRIIEAYGEGGFRISGSRHAGSVIVLPDRVIAWQAARWADIAHHPLVPLLMGESGERLDLILLGTGGRMIRLDVALRAELRALGMAAEAMDTGAACRTYNVLMAEGRRVAAAMIAVA